MWPARLAHRRVRRWQLAKNTPAVAPLRPALPAPGCGLVRAPCWLAAVRLLFSRWLPALRARCMPSAGSRAGYGWLQCAREAACGRPRSTASVAARRGPHPTAAHHPASCFRRSNCLLTAIRLEWPAPGPVAERSSRLQRDWQKQVAAAAARLFVAMQRSRCVRDDPRQAVRHRTRCVRAHVAWAAVTRGVTAGLGLEALAQNVQAIRECEC